MLIFRLHQAIGDEVDLSSAGYLYFHTRREASAEAVRQGMDPKREGVIEAQNVGRGAHEIIRILQRWGSHPDNG